MKITQSDQIYELLEEKYRRYHRLSFIEDDPISIPHLFSKKEDIEIAGFIVAIIAWGQRKSILRSGHRFLQMMDYEPHDFILNHEASDLKKTEGFVHRTFNSIDLSFFFSSLKELYLKEGGLEGAFSSDSEITMAERISRFKQLFFQVPHQDRSKKHIADPEKGSSAKRINMFLRWMVRSNDAGVDFGIWKSIKPDQLMLPLDVHTAGVSRNLGLLKRKQNDWKAVEEITEQLRNYDPKDPIKYDFALFGMGVNGDLNL